MTPGLLPQAISWGLALATILLAILLGARVARRLNWSGLASGSRGAAPALLGSLALDTRRRLHLVDVQGRAALVLTGGGSDVIVCLPPLP
jgi:flagellar biogenesis protein FliO